MNKLASVLLVVFLACAVITPPVMAETRTFAAKVYSERWPDAPLDVGDYVIGKVEWEPNILCPGCMTLLAFSFTMNNGQTVSLNDFSVINNDPPERNYSYFEDGKWHFQAWVVGEAAFEGYESNFLAMTIQQYDSNEDGLDDLNLDITFDVGPARAVVTHGSILDGYELPASTFEMNAGLNDAWYEPATSGQGSFITVFPVIELVNMAWFTYDTQLPPEDAASDLGDPGHRWFTALGKLEGNRSVLTVTPTKNGIFNSPTDVHPVERKDAGYFTLIFDDCEKGTVEYLMHSKESPFIVSGAVPIQRVAGDNILLCEELSTN